MDTTKNDRELLKQWLAGETFTPKQIELVETLTKVIDETEAGARRLEGAV